MTLSSRTDEECSFCVTLLIKFAPHPVQLILGNHMKGILVFTAVFFGSIYGAICQNSSTKGHLKLNLKGGVNIASVVVNPDSIFVSGLTKGSVIYVAAGVGLEYSFPLSDLSIAGELWYMSKGFGLSETISGPFQGVAQSTKR